MSSLPPPAKLPRSLRNRPLFWIVLVTAAAVVAAAFRFGSGPALVAGQVEPAKAQMPVMEMLPGDIVQVGRQDLRRTLALTGTVQAVRHATVKAKISGEVREITVREGDRVAAGQVIARMETREYQARLDQARGALAAAQGQLEIAQTSRNNNRALLEKGFISRNAFETTVNQYTIAQANVDSAKAAVEVARESFRDTTLRAPIEGLVSRRTVEPGEKVSPDNPLVEVVNLRQVELATPIPAADIPNVSVGQDVAVRVEGMKRPLPGRIVRINPATDAGSRSILAYIRLDNPGEALRSGMFAQAELTVARRDDVTVVPQTAIHHQGGHAFVYALKDGKIARQPVSLGEAGLTLDGPAVEVAAGLAPGDRIVRNNLGALPLGAPVQIAGAPATPETSSASSGSAASALRQ